LGRNITNPYIAGSAVKDPKMFFGREDVFDWIKNSLLGSVDQHILVIHGQRRVGKTSVLTQLGNRLGIDYIPVFFDLHLCSPLTIEQFLRGLSRDIVKAINQQLHLNLPSPDKDYFTNDIYRFENEFLFGLRLYIENRKLLIAIDEFDVLERLVLSPQEEQGTQIVELIQRIISLDWLTFIFSIGSSGRKLENMHPAFTALFKTALYRQISFLDLADTRRLIIEPVSGTLEFDDEAIDRIYQVTSGHPYYTQLICFVLFARFQNTGIGRVTADDVDASLKSAVETGTVNLKFIWDEASILEKWILTVISTVEDPISFQKIAEEIQVQDPQYTIENIHLALQHLKEKDILDSDCHLKIFLMKIWLRDNRPNDWVNEELRRYKKEIDKHNRTGDKYRDSGEDSKALENYYRVLEQDLNNVHALEGIVQIDIKRNRLQQALSRIDEILDWDPGNSEILKQRSFALKTLGQQFIKENQLEKANIYFLELLSVDEADPDAQEGLIEVSRRIVDKTPFDKKIDLAKKIYSDLSQRFPSNPVTIAFGEDLRRLKEPPIPVDTGKRKVHVLRWPMIVGILILVSFIAGIGYFSRDYDSRSALFPSNTTLIPPQEPTVVPTLIQTLYPTIINATLPFANPTAIQQTVQIQVPIITETIFSAPSPTSASTTALPLYNVGSKKSSPIDGMVLFYVPAGEFWMGTENGNPNEKPKHKIFLDAYWIDRTEVTNRQFATFVEATNYRTDAEKAGKARVWNSGRWQNTAGAYWKQPLGVLSSITGRDDYPVVDLSWNDATAYCAWAGQMLPTEAQWEKAARGPLGRIYPWGDILSTSIANYDSIIGDISPVGSYPTGASLYGPLDMAGNVWEWVQDWYSEDFYSRSPGSNPTGPATGQTHVLRGGSMLTEGFGVRSTYRSQNSPNDSQNDLGFRCVDLP
jgi:formylglycine-generating enzyme required for sulfatase activity/tetratricopeptide (TPR) repeat protein